MGILLAIIIAYLVGSFPTAYIMGHLVKGIDLREHGSGNVGATNVMRVLGVVPGVATLVIDLLKGYVVVAVIAWLICPGEGWLPLCRILSCAAVIAGHNWMLFLGFRGGKGVATTAGAFLALAPVATISAFTLWGIVVVLTRYVSLGSITAGISLPIFMRIFYPEQGIYTWFAVLLAVLMLFMHRNNISRLIKGTERKLGKGDSKN